MTSTLSSLVNHQVRLASRPVGLPNADNWQFSSEPVAEPGAGGVLVKTLALSLDPAMRGWMNEGKSYIPPVGIGEVMRACGVGVVIASQHPDFAVGDHVAGGAGVQEYFSVAGDQIQRSGLSRIDLRLGTLTQWLNVLGMPGMTAYFGLMDVGQPQPGDTVVVSGAAGAVGQTVGQLAKILGCRVVGIAGGPAKCEWVVRELGFDACIDYKAPPPPGAGAISQYNNTTAVQGPKNYLSLLVNRARMQGMVVFDYAGRYPQAVAELAVYLKDGRMKSREDVVEGGVAAFPEALNRLFSGRNFGKLVLQVAEA